MQRRTIGLRGTRRSAPLTQSVRLFSVENIRQHATFFLILLGTFLAACGRAQYSADYKIPESHFILRVELKQANFLLAEYQRRLVIVRAGLPLLRVDLGGDIGGYTAVNLYRLQNGEYLIAHDGNPQYRVNPNTGSVQAEVWGLPPREDRRPRDAVFSGAFDFDGNHTWRFLPASQRAERELGKLYGS